MADATDAIEGLQFSFSEFLVAMAKDQFDCFLDAARCLGAPHLAISARTDLLRDRIAIGKFEPRLRGIQHVGRVIEYEGVGVC